MDGAVAAFFPREEGASRAVYGKGTDESLAPRKMKFQVLRFFLSFFPSSPPPLFSVQHRGSFRGIVYADETSTRVGQINV